MREPANLQANSFSYWDPLHPAITKWLINGSDIGPGFNNQTHINPSQIGSASLQVGNDIGPLAYVTFPVSAFNGVEYPDACSFARRDISVSSTSKTWIHNRCYGRHR